MKPTLFPVRAFLDDTAELNQKLRQVICLFANVGYELTGDAYALPELSEGDPPKGLLPQIKRELDELNRLVGHLNIMAMDFRTFLGTEPLVSLNSSELDPNADR